MTLADSERTMPARMPARIEDDDRRRRIMIAAYELLDEEGLDGLTIRAVLKRSGLSRRAVYERYAAKDDLMLAVFDHTIQLATDQFEHRLADIPDPLARLRFIVTGIVLGRDAFGAPAAQESRIGAAMSHEHLRLAESHPAALHRALAPLIGLIADQLAEAIRIGRARDGDTVRTATFLYNLVSTTVHKELMADDAGNRQGERAELAEDLWTFCERAITR